MADHASAGFETGASGAIMTVPGGTLPRGVKVFGISTQFVSMDEISDAELEALGATDEDVHSTKGLVHLVSSFSYGVSDNLTVGINLPYVERHDIRAAHNHLGMGEVEFAGNSAGLGDMNLFAQYRFYRDDVLDAALIAGMKFPTGTTRERGHGGELFEADNQPGSGSWDQYAGLAFDRRQGPVGYSANVLYSFTQEGSQKTDLGDVFNYNLALSYRAWSPDGAHEHRHHHHAAGIVDFIDLALELNGDVRGKDEINSVMEEHSGGHVLYVSPGLRIGLGHRGSVFSSLGVPIVNDLNGRQSEPDYRIIAGFSVTF